VTSTDHKVLCYVVFSTLCYLIPLRRKYLSQQPVLEDPQPTFLVYCAAEVNLLGQTEISYRVVQTALGSCAEFIAGVKGIFHCWNAQKYDNIWTRIEFRENTAKYLQTLHYARG
jgi:hypothetical protein